MLDAKLYNLIFLNSGLMNIHSNITTTNTLNSLYDHTFPLTKCITIRMQLYFYRAFKEFNQVFKKKKERQMRENTDGQVGKDLSNQNSIAFKSIKANRLILSSYCMHLISIYGNKLLATWAAITLLQLNI